MKALYWRPQRISLRVMLLLTFAALCSLLAVESFPARERQSWYTDKVQAARLAGKAFKVVKEARLKKGIAIDREADPAQSGFIGEIITPITTNTGHLPAKLTSANPNFAAVVVEMLRTAKVKRGDTVAVGFSGSFPALNVCVLAAIHAIEAKPIVISSVGASQWGANNPAFTWLDMEQALIDGEVLPYRSIAVSPGGIDDRAVGISKEGKKRIDEAIARNGVAELRPEGYEESLDRRMALYREQAGETEIRAYVNVGGGTTSVGTKLGKLQFEPGLNTSLPRGPTVDSVMARFAADGVPVIHLVEIDELAQKYSLPLQPQRLPPVGEGAPFVRVGYSRWLAGGCLALLVALLVALLRLDVGHRLFGSKRAPSPASLRGEPMV